MTKKNKSHVKFLDAMAQGIYYYEGHMPNDPNHRNNNPGNLRPLPGNQYPVSDDGYTIYPSFVVGYDDLRNDLRDKITGHNDHGLDLDSSLLALFRVYAPVDDENQPVAYAKFIAWWLSETYGTNIVFIEPIWRILQRIGKSVD